MDYQSKPQTLNGAGAGAAPSFPPTKAQQYGATRPAYRPGPMKPPPRRSSRRSCCCSFFLWIIVVIVAIIVLAAIAGGIFYLIYRPHRPSFTVSALRLTAFNITTNNQLTSRLALNVTATNPNKKLVYIYDDVAISVLSGGVDIGDGSFPSFRQNAGDSQLLSATVSTGVGDTLDPSTASDLKKKNSLSLEIDLETKAGVKVGSLTTKKIGIRVRCSSVNVAVPKGKTVPAVTAPDVKCMVKTRVKIWKWYI